MELVELTKDQHVETVKNEIRNLEQQWVMRRADVTKYEGLLSAADSGEFRSMHKDIVRQRVLQWQAERDSARIDVRVLEISLDNAKARLADLQPATEE